MIVTGRRKSNPLGLEKRVRPKHGAFYYVHPNDRWERLGTDVADANRKARLYNDTKGSYGTIAYWLDMWVIDCERRVKEGKLAARTYDDYKTDIEPLKIYFKPPMRPTDIDPLHVQDYLNIGEENDRPVRANREKAALSSCMSWLIRTGKVEGLKLNPCLRASGIRRNREKKRERYVTHDEYREVFNEATFETQAMMTLTYRTLQRPESDILDWTIANIVKKDGKRIIRNEQAKVRGTTGKTVDIEIDPEVSILLDKLIGEVPKIGRPLITPSRGKKKGQKYTYDGISANLKKAIGRANKKHKEQGIDPIPSFGYRDLKGKGATDMWLSGVPLEEIQLLCGHEDKATTEIYIKQRWRKTAKPNMVKMAG